MARGGSCPSGGCSATMSGGRHGGSSCGGGGGGSDGGRCGCRECSYIARSMQVHI